MQTMPLMPQSGNIGRRDLVSSHVESTPTGIFYPITGVEQYKHVAVFDYPDETHRFDGEVWQVIRKPAV